jgi:hypothetical protein
MPFVDQVRADRLIALTREHFDTDLSPIEEQVLRHSCGYEDPPDWIAPAQDSNAEMPPSEPHPTIDPTGRPLPGWQGPELRSALLRWLLTDPEAAALHGPEWRASSHHCGTRVPQF